MRAGTITAASRWATQQASGASALAIRCRRLPPAIAGMEIWVSRCKSHYGPGDLQSEIAKPKKGRSLRQPPLLLGVNRPGRLRVLLVYPMQREAAHGHALVYHQKAGDGIGR